MTTSSTHHGINTCANSLINTGTCCTHQCNNPATTAITTGQHQLTEHTRCPQHTHQPGETTHATKPLIYSHQWAHPTQNTITTTHAHSLNNATLDKSEGNYKMACTACGHTDPNTWDQHITHAINNTHITALELNP